MQSTYIKFVTQTLKIIQEILNKIFNHEPPQKTLFLIVSHTFFVLDVTQIYLTLF